LVQIIGGQLELALKFYDIKADKKYESEPDILDISLQVWELSDEEFGKLTSIEDDWFEQSFAYTSWWINGGCNHSKDQTAVTEINNNMLTVFTEEFSGEEIVWGYVNLNDYFESHLGISKYNNMAYYIHSLAELNNMTKADFMKKYW